MCEKKDKTVKKVHLLRTWMDSPVQDGQRCRRGFLWWHIEKKPSYLGLCCIRCSINDVGIFGDWARLKIFPVCWVRICTPLCWLEDLCFPMLLCNTVNICPVCAWNLCMFTLQYSICGRVTLQGWNLTNYCNYFLILFSPLNFTLVTK